MEIGEKTENTIFITRTLSKLKVAIRLFTSLLLGLATIWVLLAGIGTNRITLAQEKQTGMTPGSLAPQPVMIATIPLSVPAPLIRAAVAVNPSTGYAYISARAPYSYLDATLMIISGTEVIASRASTDYGGALAVNPNLGHVYMPAVGGVVVISGIEIVGVIPIDREPLTSLGLVIDVEPTSGYIYASGYDRGLICIPELSCIGGIIWVFRYGGSTRLNLSGPVEAIGINPVTGYVYATYHREGLLGFRRTVVIQGVEEIAEIQSFGETIGINPNNGYVYIAGADQNRVHVISGTQVIQTLITGADPRAIGVNPSTGYVYVANTGSNSVTVISATQVVTTLPVGLEPEAIGVNPESGYIYVANAGDDTLSVISGTQIISSLPVGRAPRAIDVNPDTGYIYVVNYNDATISVIRELILSHRGYLPLIVKD